MIIYGFLSASCYVCADNVMSACCGWRRCMAHTQNNMWSAAFSWYHAVVTQHNIHPNNIIYFKNPFDGLYRLLYE